MSKEGKTGAKAKTAKKDTKPTSKPTPKKTPAPKAPKKDLKNKQVKKDAKKAPKKDVKKAPKKDVKKDVKKDAKKEVKKDVKKPEEKKTEIKKKPSLPAVIGRGKQHTAAKTQSKNAKKTTSANTKKDAKTNKVEKKDKKDMKDKKDATQKKAKKSKKDKKPCRSSQNPHIIARPKSFHIGGDLPPKRDLSRMVKWPEYIRLQRKKKIMYNRLKVPAMINQFTQTLDKHSAKVVLRLLWKYRPESPKSRKSRLLGLAKAKRAGKKIVMYKPYTLKQGANHVTQLIERKEAKLVVIANDVDPIEHVLFLPTLCRKMQVPYCIVKNKARLGRLVRMKTCTCVALTTIRKEDKIAFGAIRSMCKTNYNKRGDQIVKNVGGGKLGLRSSIALRKRAEALKKASLEKQSA